MYHCGVITSTVVITATVLLLLFAAFGQYIVGHASGDHVVMCSSLHHPSPSQSTLLERTPSSIHPTPTPSPSASPNASRQYFHFSKYFSSWPFPLSTSFEYGIHSSHFPSSLHVDERYIVYTSRTDPFYASQENALNGLLSTSGLDGNSPLHYPLHFSSSPKLLFPGFGRNDPIDECIFLNRFKRLKTLMNSTSSSESEDPVDVSQSQIHLDLLWLNGTAIIDEIGVPGLLSLLIQCEQYVDHSILISIMHPNYSSPLSKYYTRQDLRTEPFYSKLDAQFIAPYSYWRIKDDYDSGFEESEYQELANGNGVQNIHLYRINHRHSFQHQAFEYISSIQYADQNLLLRREHSPSISTGLIIRAGAGAALNSAVIQMSYSLHANIPIEFTGFNFGNWAYANSPGLCGSVQNLSCYFLPASNIKLNLLLERRMGNYCKPIDITAFSRANLKRLGAYPSPQYPPGIAPNNTNPKAKCYELQYGDRNLLLRRFDRLHRPFPFRHQSKLWWRTIIVDYLTRPNRMTRKYVSSQLKSIGFPSNREIKAKQWKCIAVHIRHGDKGVEAELHGAEAYMEKIRFFKNFYNVENVFIASDDHTVIEELVENYKNESINWLWNQNEERWNSDAAKLLTSNKKKEFAAVHHTLNLITTMKAASKCNYLINTFSSNIGQLMYTSQLANTYLSSSHSIDSSEWNIPHISLDTSWYDITQYVFYGKEWYETKGALPDHETEMHI